ncbi:helix-turn-helix domain-containing protein [Streptomyces sp. LARHCF252]
MDQPPTLEEIKTWPATISVAEAARALGVSRSHLYELIRAEESPVRVLRLGSVRVITASLVEVLSV